MLQQIKNIYHLFIAFLSLIFYRFPSRNLKIIGVTGTDGKTTTATLIYYLLDKAGFKTALISTVSAKVGEREIETGLHATTPDPKELQRLIRLASNEKVEYLVLEATSHGLDQHRLFGVKFLVGVITNVTHEHLDYHKTWENYLKAKAKLFRGVKVAVLNREDKSFNYLKSIVSREAKIVTYGLRRGDFTPKGFKFKTSLPGEYNQYNCLAAIATASSLGLSGKVIRKGIASFKPVKGRLEEINQGQDFKVLIDFAHTPNALENVLKLLSNLKPQTSNLIVVFGCAGERDRTKRPVMGEVAARLADMTVLTAEDPRTEDVNEIISQIARGCQKAGGIEGKTFFKFPDRAEAIQFVIKKAQKGDIIVICGKGHEKSMCFGKIEHPWSDQETARQALKKVR